MQNPIRLLILTLLISLSLPARAQQPQIRFEHFTIEQGLTSNTVRALLQDSRGFLWFATANGLNRYDGYRFTPYKNVSMDSTSLIHNWINTLYEAPSEPDVLWVGTRDGLDRFDRITGVFTHYRHDPKDPHSLSHNEITTIDEDRRGVLWVGTWGGGFNRLDRATGTFIQYVHEPGNTNSLGDPRNRVLAFCEDQAGMFWIGTERGLDRWDPATGVFTHYLDGTMVEAVYEDRSGMLWVGTQAGLFRLDPATARFRQYRHDPDAPRSLSDDWISFIYEDAAGMLWIGTFLAGLNRFDPAQGVFTHYRHDPQDPHSLSDDFITFVYEDPSGVLWVGTNNAGVNKFDQTASLFTHYTEEAGNPNSLSNSYIRALYEAPLEPGVLWIGTEAGGLNRLDRATGRFTHYRHEEGNPQSLLSNSIYVIYEAPSEPGVLWIVAYQQGLSRFDRATGVFTHYRHDPNNPQGLADAIVRAVYEDRAGRLWVGTKWGLDLLDRETGIFTHFRHEEDDPHSLVDNRLRVLYEAPSEPGVLWIGTDGGLDRFDVAEGVFTHYRSDPDDPQSLSYNSIRSIYEDRVGHFWIGTRSGLNRLDRQTGRFTWFTEDDGLPSGVIQDILEDEYDYLWLSTARGLARFDPRRQGFRTYDADDGLLNRAFDLGAYSQSGELFFGGLDGLDVFHPDDLQDNLHVPPVVLTAFTQFGEPVRLDRDIAEIEEIQLSYRDTHFGFEFAALDFANPQKNQYAYRLEPFESEWIPAGTRREARYTNLDPGTYTFRVKGSNNDGVWNEEGTAVRVVITPPWWKTQWFRVLGLMGIVGVFYSIYLARVWSITARNRALQQEIDERKRVERERETFVEELEAKNAELERFTYTVSHDLKSPLVTIKGFLGLLEKDALAGDIEHMKRDIEHVNAATETMARLLAELLELSRIGRVMNPPEDVPLNDLAREALALVEGELVARGVEVEIDPALPVVAGDRVRLLEVYQNLIENAVKFMGDQPKPRVELGARIEGTEVVCFIRDNGMGIDPKYHTKVFELFERLDQQIEGTGIGLALVKRIVEMHGGRIWVESEGEGKGSTFYFTLPSKSS